MASYAMHQAPSNGTRLGGGAFNHSSSGDAEAEYDRLRNLARSEAGKRGACFDKSHQAYERGDGAAAHQLSEEGKQHGDQMKAYNKQASDFIFRQNNAPGKVADDTIDLHGQFVEEAEEIIENRIRYAQSTNQTHLHVIVGKGNHSVDHIQKIKPKVEQICQSMNLQYTTEANAGRMYIDLQGGPAVMPPQGYQNGGYQGGQQQHGGYQGGQQQPAYGGPQQGGYQGGQQQGGYQGGQQGNQNDEIEQLVQKFLPRLLSKLFSCFR